MPSGAQAIFVASNGPYDFLGTKYFRDVRGQPLRSPARGSGRADVRLRAGRLSWLSAAGFRGQQDAGAVRAARQFGLRPVQAVAAGASGQWRGRHAGDGRVRARLQGAGRACAHAAASRSQPPPVAAWVEAWSDARVNVAILAVLLSVLTLIFVFQATLARFRLRPPAGAQRIPAGRSGLARLDRRRAALDRQCHELSHGAVQTLRYRLLSRRAADGHHRRSTRWSRWC